MISTLSKLAFLTAYALFLLKVFTGWGLTWLTACLGILILLTNIGRVKGNFRKPILFFFSVGTALLLWKKADPAMWAAAVNSQLRTAIILGLMQTLTVSMSVGRYKEAVTSYLSRYAKNESRLYIFITVFSHMLASILNLGSLYIILSSIGEGLAEQIRDYKKFISKAASRGVATTFIWAPGSIVTLSITQAFQISWARYFIYGFCMAVICMTLGFLLEARQLRGHLLMPIDSDMSPRETQGKVSQLLLVIAGLIGGILLLDKLGFSDSGGRLLLMVIIISSLWLFTNRKNPGFAGAVRDFWREGMDKNADLSVFFITIGVFSSGVEHSGLNEVIRTYCQGHIEFLRSYILFLLPLLVLMISICGVHPLASVMMLGPVAINLPLMVSNFQLAAATALGCGLTFLISPFSGTSLIIAKVLDVPARETALGSNALCGAAFYAAGLAFIHFVIPQ